MTASGQVLQLPVTRCAPSNADSRESQIVKGTQYALRVAKMATLPETVPRQAEETETIERMSIPQSGCVTGLCPPSWVVSYSTSDRCGSTKHTLSRCKKTEDPLNPLPFASCFVCSGRGHLASACPQNKEKGIYPNGGCCKLCGEKTHLARDCELRKKDASGTVATTIFGTGSGAGADEDDFHAFKRKNVQVSKDEKKEDRLRKKLDVKAGMHTGTVKAFGKTEVSSKPKKVVFF